MDSTHICIFWQKNMLSYLFVRDAEINIGTWEETSFKAFDLKKHVVTGKRCLRVTICLEDKIFPQIRNIIYSCKITIMCGRMQYML